MKSRSASPATPIVKRYRVESSPAGTTAAPNIPRKSSLRVEQLPDIDMNGFQTATSPSTTVTQPPGLLTNGSRIPSSEQLRTTPSRLETLKQNGVGASPSANSPLSAASENSPAAWSSAIGHATTTGKSGRVIERLMNENDKLKRDLNEQIVRCQELEKSLQTYKPQIEALRQENDNLSHARGVDSNLISRRDRKIEELKADLATERSRRETAESLARQKEQERDEIEEQSRRDLQNMTESTKHATLHAEILETSHKQLSAEYRARAEVWKKDLRSIADGREQDRRKLARLDVVANQMRQELERSKKLNGDLIEKWENLREEQDLRIKGIEDDNNAELERSKNLSAQMDEVVKQMRWCMAVKNAVKE